MLKKLLALSAFALFVLVVGAVVAIGWAVQSAEAHGTPENCLHRDPTHKHCTPPADEPGTGTVGCQLTFDVTFRDGGSDKVRSDGGMCPSGNGDYCDGFEKVVAFTGSGDGFRFDTNKSQKLFQTVATRTVDLDLDGNGNTGLFQVDLRFSGDPNFDDARLDLCSLPMVGDQGLVGLDIQFLNADGEVRALSYVTDCWNQDGSPQASASQKVQVTRTQVFGMTGAVVDEWTIETVGAKKACLRDGYRFAPLIQDIVAPFEMTLTAQEPVE